PPPAQPGRRELYRLGHATEGSTPNRKLSAPGGTVRAEIQCPVLSCEVRTMFFGTKRQRAQRRGASLVLIALLMMAVIAMAAFAVEMGRMYLVRAQLQTAVDSGALAAAIQIKQNPGNVALAELAAQEYVQRNRVGWAVTVPDEAIMIETGTW